jgi:beta-lactamase regulating signal transducer with metallopeptidase domain
MTPLALALSSALLHLVWQGAVTALLLWIVLAALRGRSANVRYAASCAALGLLALAPVMTMFLAYQRPSRGARADAAFAAAVFATPIAAPVDWLAIARIWMLPVWACGVALLSIRLLWAYTKVSALKRTGDPAEPAVLAMVSRLAERLGVARSVRVLISSLADGPSVIGTLRPVILLPAATLLGLTPAQLEAVLAHELAHIRRHDYLFNLVQMLMETLFFYHPAVWWISSRIRQERELCCDDIAVDCCGDAVRYARALTVLERMRVAGPRLALGIQDGPLMYRIQRLLGATPREQGPSRLPAIAAILLALVCFSIEMNPVKAQAPLPRPPAPTAPPVLLVAPPHLRPGMLLQVAQATPPAQSAPLSSPDAGVPVAVQVTIDQNGLVSDAYVLSGPAGQRRSALLMALNMRFPDAPSTTRVVDIPPIPAPLANRSFAFLYPPGDRRMALQNELTALLLYQQNASLQGAAQLQEQIDSLRASLSGEPRQDAPPRESAGPFAGEPLGDIRILGVTDSQRDQLLARLPLFIRHPLTQESIAASLQAVHDFDPNATAYFTAMRPGQAAFIVQVP